MVHVRRTRWQSHVKRLCLGMRRDHFVSPGDPCSVRHLPKCFAPAKGMPPMIPGQRQAPLRLTTAYTLACLFVDHIVTSEKCDDCRTGPGRLLLD
ncbi:uncharacterized protein K489DRAFT_152987 [Dissoconium aciculare CBS 342.82]|uniref:Uncharacterized protein n=1 Tax=Dissoconium aciculare CBS 342.82 TaxID=1314786 RepID=A0A6J3MBK8_9PEZI|nr:uncharacterized protein K489DRAFT_152987 [Dissoconium aciculare CBS 342.82]KAF1825258.1 hypothetical protein K489DRAFT_152987 [Dissoconium aciculare CBS 342.82]